MISRNIFKYNISLELVVEQDAIFIVNLRQGERNKHISQTDTDISKQVEWIKEYKIREANNLEYYFIAKDINKKKWGTIRLYNLNGERFELGSWVFLKNSPEGIAIKSDIIVRELAFEELGFNICNFDVRKDNKNVLRYHYGYKPNIISEDELHFPF
jgi:hypothetical protein